MPYKTFKANKSEIGHRIVLYTIRLYAVKRRDNFYLKVLRILKESHTMNNDPLEKEYDKVIFEVKTVKDFMPNEIEAIRSKTTIIVQEILSYYHILKFCPRP